MSEIQSIYIDMGDRQVEATPFNSRLYTFIGRAVLENGYPVDISTRNHVYVEFEEEVEEEVEAKGMYIFGEAVQELGSIMLKNHFPASLNNRRVLAADETAYQRYLQQIGSTEDLGDYIPDEWGD